MAKTASLLTNHFRSLVYKPTQIPSNFLLPTSNLRSVTPIQTISTFQLVPTKYRSSLFQFVDRIDDRREVGTTRSEYRWKMFKASKTVSYSKRDRYIPLMLFREVVWPSPFNNLKTFVFANLFIPHFIDPRFRKNQFLNEAKLMVLKVSKLLAIGEIADVKGLLTIDAIKELRPNLIKMGPEQRQALALEAESIILGFIYSLDVKVDKSTIPQKREVEITCCFHAYKDNQVAGGILSFPLRKIFQNREKHIICNYRFVRDYTQGVNGRWMINRLNHFTVVDAPPKFRRRRKSFPRFIQRIRRADRN